MKRVYAPKLGEVQIDDIASYWIDSGALYGTRTYRWVVLNDAAPYIGLEGELLTYMEIQPANEFGMVLVGYAKSSDDSDELQWVSLAKEGHTKEEVAFPNAR